METKVKNVMWELLYHLFLSGLGWKKRKCRLVREMGYEWRDPESGLWFSQATAIKLSILGIKLLPHSLPQAKNLSRQLNRPVNSGKNKWIT